MGITRPPHGLRVVHSELMGKSPENNSRILAQIETCRRANYLRLLVLVGPMLMQTATVATVEEGLRKAQEYVVHYHTQRNLAAAV